MPGAASPPVARVLELDPDLGAGVWPQDWEAARRACRGELLWVPRGRWIPPEVAGDRNDIVGLVIVEGLLCREVGLRDRHMLELLGPGDVLQLPVLATRPRLARRIELTTVSDAKLVVLGKSFIHAAARWPGLLAAVQHRLETQREHLAIQGLIAHLPHAEHRLLVTLWHLAERFGHVTPSEHHSDHPLRLDPGTVRPAARSIVDQSGSRRKSPRPAITSQLATPTRRLIAFGRIIASRLPIPRFPV